MAKPKSITIKLTEKQRSQLRSLTGEDHKEVKFEATRGGKLAPKMASRLAARAVGRSIGGAKFHDATLGSPFPKFPVE